MQPNTSFLLQVKNKLEVSIDQNYVERMREGEREKPGGQVRKHSVRERVRTGGRWCDHGKDA